MAIGTTGAGITVTGVGVDAIGVGVGGGTTVAGIIVIGEAS
jgi:hypothetical protein